MQRRKKWDCFMFCLLNISDLGLWQNDTRKNPAEMSLVWINLHHLEAGGSILIEEAAMIQWPLTPRVTGNKYSRIASFASGWRGINTPELRVLRALITYLHHSLPPSMALVILMVYIVIWFISDDALTPLPVSLCPSGEAGLIVVSCRDSNELP